MIRGVWETQATVLCAGGIMAAVFFGLLLASETAINQFGFILFVGVLVDTFVVQALLFPAVLSLDVGRWSFWPRAMPDDGPRLGGGVDDENVA